MGIDAAMAGAVANSPGRAAPERKPKLLSLVDAQARVLARLPLMPPETVSLDCAYGRVSSEDIRAMLTYPTVPLSAMDGYACRSADTTRLPVRLHQIGVSRAGERFGGTLQAGICVRVFTGGMVPEGADTIAIQEDTADVGGTIEIREVAKPGAFIRRPGLDFEAGDLCVKKGRALTARDIGILAASGHLRFPFGNALALPSCRPATNWYRRELAPEQIRLLDQIAFRSPPRSGDGAVPLLTLGLRRIGLTRSQRLPSAPVKPTFL
jgi:hypothetical protein